MTVAFALSGGANLGPMQAGTTVALMEAGIEPDMFVGTSVGALNAAFLATRPGVRGARMLRSAWSDLGRREGFRFNVLAAMAGFLGLRDHLVSAEHFRRLIRRWVEIDRIEQATVPLAAVATDALTGEAVVLTTGDTTDALAASAAIPGIFPPVRIGDRWLIDGSLAASRPVLQAQDLGADDVYVITTATAPRLRPPRGAVAMAMNSVSLVTARAAHEQLLAAAAQADRTGGHVHVVPSAEPVAPGPFDFRRSAALAQAAYQRTTAWLTREHVLGAGGGTSVERMTRPVSGVGAGPDEGAAGGVGAAGRAGAVPGVGAFGGATPTELDPVVAFPDETPGPAPATS